MAIDDELTRRFVCARCKGAGGTAKRFAATGTGLSRWFDIQHNVFIAVSCKACGYTDLFNPEVLEGKDNVGAILDAIFGD